MSSPATLPDSIRCIECSLPDAAGAFPERLGTLADAAILPVHDAPVPISLAGSAGPGDDDDDDDAGGGGGAGNIDPDDDEGDDPDEDDEDGDEEPLRCGSPPIAGFAAVQHFVV